MKRLIALCLALLVAFVLFAPVLAEEGSRTAEAAEATEAAAETEAAEAAEAAAETEAAEAAEAAAETEAAAEEETVEEASSSVPSFLEKFTELPWYVVAILIALFAAGIILFLSAKKTAWNIHAIAMGAMCISIAFVLSCIRLYRMPQGGSITPAHMLPLVLFMVAYGPLQGFVVGCAYGLLKLIADPYIIHPIQMLVDYPLAYGAMILCCLATLLPLKNRGAKLAVAVLLAGVARLIMSTLSGAVFFADYAGEQNAWIYSLTYNIGYLGPDTLVCMIIACIPGIDRLVTAIRKK